MKNLYLHIGTHKTGTTSIQQAIRKNVEKLKELDYLWVEESYLLFKRFNPQGIESVVNFIEKLKSIPQNNLIFSSEGYTGGFENDINIVKQKAEILNKILQGFNVKVIIYLRRQDQLIESLYIQSVQAGNSYIFNEYLNDIIDYKYFDWQNLINIFSDHFGSQNIFARPYDKTLFYKNNIIYDFFSVLDLKDKIEIETLPQWNKSYSHQTLRIARYMNSILSSKEDKAKLRSILQSLSTKDIFEKHCYLTPEKRQEILSYHHDSNTEISYKFFHQDKNIFSLSDADLKLPVADSTTITNEDLAAITMRLFLSMTTTRVA